MSTRMTMNTQTRTIVDPYSAVAFYGFDRSVQSRQAFYELSVEWFQEKGVTPDVAYLQGAGFSGKTIRFTSAQSQLRRKGYENLEGFSLVAMTPGGEDVVRDAVLTAEWGVRSQTACIEASAAVTSLADPALYDLAKRAVLALSPAYGIGFTMAHDRGPGFYCLGLIYAIGVISETPEAEEHARRIEAWENVAMLQELYRKGILRDVYPWNFLTESHVARRVERQPLLKWINKDPKRGTIAEFVDGVWLWEVEDDHLDEVRTVVSRAGLVLDPADYGR